MRLGAMKALSTSIVALAFASSSLAQPNSSRVALACPVADRVILNPVASPDGKEVAWTSSCNGGWNAQIWIASAGGSRARELAGVSFVSQLAWQQDTGLLYTGIDRLWRLSRRGARGLAIADYQQSAQQIATDAVGDRIAWGVFGVRGPGPILIKSLVHRWTRAVGDAARFQDGDPTLSPDGQRIAFERRSCPKLSSDCRGMAGIWVAPVAGGQVKRITRTGYWPEWSPDGRWILYADGRGHLIVVTPDGRRRTTLPDGGTARTPAPNFRWSPDAQSIAVWLGGPLRIFDAATGRGHTVAGDGIRGVTDFGWASNSQSLFVSTKERAHSCPSLWRVQANGTGADRLLDPC
jgi:WD40-like Beta Propeller Repeat